MKKLALVLIIMFCITCVVCLIADLHCRVIKLETKKADQEELEFVRGDVQRLLRAVFEGKNEIKLGPGGWMRLVLPEFTEDEEEDIKGEAMTTQIIKMYYEGKQVSEISVEELEDHGWDLGKFCEAQEIAGRTWEIENVTPISN